MGEEEEEEEGEEMRRENRRGGMCSGEITVDTVRGRLGPYYVLRILHMKFNGLEFEFE